MIGQTGVRQSRSAVAAIGQLVALLIGCFSATVGAQVTHTYEDTVGGNLASCTGGGGLTRLINVPESFTVGVNNTGTIALGVDITHADRDEVNIFLTPPGGTQITVYNPGAINSANLFATFVEASDAGDVDVAGADLDTPAADDSTAGGNVRYRRLIQVGGLDAGAGGINSSGNWTLRVCDDTGAATGTLRRARLILRNTAATAPTNVCGSQSSYDWGANGNETAFPVSPTLATGLPVGGVSFTQISRWDPVANGPTGDIRQSYETCTGAGPDGGAADRCNFRLGNHIGYYKFSMNMGNDGDVKPNVEQGTFEFNVPVLGLNLLALDIDFQNAGNDFEDMFRIEGFAGTGATGASVPYQLTLVGGTPSAQIAGDWVEGDADAPGYDNTNGNLQIRFAGPVRSVRVAYAQGNQPTTNSDIQYIGISDFTYCAFDYGDAPSAYLVTLGENGPRHVLGDRLVYIGNPPDGESNGVESVNADSDQATNSDEAAAQSLPDGIPTYLPQGGQVCDAGGGVTYTTPQPAPGPGTPGQYCMVVAATTGATAATLVGWIDFNNDGDFADAGERSRADLGGTGPVETYAGGNIAASTSGQRILVWDNVQVPDPGTLTTAAKVLRLRISTDATVNGMRTANPLPNSATAASDGEIEDHLLPLNTLPVTLAYVDVQRADTGSVRVSWTTVTEAGARGFRILQQGDGGIAPAAGRMVPSAVMTATTPSDYETWVSTSSNGPIYIEEVSVSGRVERFGPYPIGSTAGAKPRLVSAPWLQSRTERNAHAAVDNAARLSRAATRGLDPAAEILVSKTGWQRVPVADLAAAGVDFVGRQAADLRLAHGGTVVPFRVAGGATVLSASSVIEFWGEALADSLYTSTRPYLLEVAAGGLPWTVENGSPLAGPVSTTWSTRGTLGADRFYSMTSPNGDPWYFDVITRNGPPQAGKQWTLNLPGANPTEGGRVWIELWGGVGIPELPDDHRYRLSINGVALGEDSFDGVTAHERWFEVGPGVLQAGANTVRLDLIQTGDTFDRVYVDEITVWHKAPMTANAGLIDVRQGAFVGVEERLFAEAFEDEAVAPVACGLGCEQVEVGGFASPDIVAMRITPQGPIELAGVVTASVAGGYVARVRSTAHGVRGDGDQEADRLVLVDRSLSQVPALRPALALPHPLTGGPAELLLISSSRFAGSLDALVSARQAEGLSVRVVTVEQVYAAYNGGIVDPESIRRFIGDARQQLATRYVLLVGGDTYDYFDHLGLGSVSDVPTLYRKTHEYVNFAPVDSAFGDSDGDGRPDVSIGRLPARTLPELQTLLTKVLSPMPQNPLSSLFIAERASVAEGINYSSELDALIADLGDAWQGGVNRVYLDTFPNTGAGTAAARSDVASQVNAGRNWVSFYGHASPATWSRETLLEADQLSALLNNAGRWPVVSEFGCWGGYFVEPEYTTLAHSWLLTADRGARAMLASSSLTESSSDRAIAEALIPQLGTPGIRLGDALLNAQGEVHAASHERVDVIYGMTLLGDPSARLTPPN